MYNKNLLKSLFTFVLFSATLIGCEKKNPNFQQEAANAEFLHQSMLHLTSVIKHDLFPPMIASRIYAYAHIAAYEALNPHTEGYRSMGGQLNGLGQMPQPEAGKDYCFPLASVKAYLKVGKKLIFSEDSITAFEQKIFKTFKDIGIPKDIYDRSLAFGDTIGGAIIKWSTKDNYAQTRSMPKYTVTPNNPARWRPTAPDYADGLEPHWRKIRTMVMDSAAQFKPAPATPFDSTKNSRFYKEAYEVYQIVADSTPERIATGLYWDDSPASTNNAGHVNFVIKKVTPPGHWLHIAMYVGRQQKKSIYDMTEAYALVAISEFDGSISCWDEKYRSEVIRPETYISKYIAPEWVPIIVTPPFPEYTSGHSVFSGAASVTLSTLFGENINFIDSTEVQFGMPPRTFTSFEEAAKQAAVSRIYAGIHYRPACDNGMKQGKDVGNFVLQKIKTRRG